MLRWSWVIIFIWLISVPNLFAADLKVGKPAPDFSTKDDQGKTVSLKELRGKQIVLFFYPKDNTPGCTLEAIQFQNLLSDFQKNGILIFGISYDDEPSHQRFKRERELTFPLLLDPDRKISEAYGTDGPYFADRVTFVINQEGLIERIYRNVNPSGHAAVVFKDLTTPETQASK